MKKLLLLLPIIGGVTFAQLFLKNTSSSSLKPYEQEVPTGQHQNQLANTTLLPNQAVSQYLLQSQALLSKAFELSSQNSDASKNEQVVRLINEAITQATQATIAAPQDARGFAQRGKIYKTIEKYLDNALQAALKDYLRATRLDPYQLDYYQQTAELYLKLEKPALAQENWQKAAYLNPTDPQAWYSLAKIQTSLGNLKQAKISYQRILSLVVELEQKQEIEKEIIALNKLLAQAGEQPLPTASLENKVILPDQPLQLEAKIASNVIIAEPQEKADLVNSTLESNALSGVGAIPAQETTVVIENTQIQTNSEIYLSALDNLSNQILRVGNKKKGSFTVEVPKGPEEEISFRYWIIN